MKRLSRYCAILLFGASGAALAHTGHATHGFGSGLVHPFSGLDHLLAMVAVGLWAVQRDSAWRSLWPLPAAFMAALAVGAAAALAGFALPIIEAGIAASVLVLGLMLALAVRLPTAAALVITAAFGLLHGHAHGAEMPTAVAPWAYGAGFLLATAVLHGSGLLAGISVRKRLVRAAGGAIALSGAWMLATL